MAYARACLYHRHSAAFLNSFYKISSTTRYNQIDEVIHMRQYFNTLMLSTIDKLK